MSAQGGRKEQLTATCRDARGWVSAPLRDLLHAPLSGLCWATEGKWLTYKKLCDALNTS